MENILRTTINISELEQGMTVEHNGNMYTVSRNDVKYDRLWGYSYRGDSSRQTITRIQFAVPTSFGIVLR